MFWVEQLKRFFVYSCVFDKHFRLFNLKGFNWTFKTRVLIFKKTLSVTPPWLFPLCHFFVVCVCVCQPERSLLCTVQLWNVFTLILFFWFVFFSLFWGAGIDFYVCPLRSCYLSCYCHKLQTYFVNYFYECCYLDLRSSQPHISLIKQPDALHCF